jgi:hypothetical protein
MCCAPPGVTRGPSVATISSRGQGPYIMHRRPQPHQVGPYEARLGGDTGGGSRQAGAVDCS